MTSQTETNDFDMKLVDLLQKKFCEEKNAHGETTLQLLSAQAQAQTAKAEAAKAQELVAETTLKLDQAREEIKRLRVLTRGGQVQALEAQAKIESLEDQMAQMRLSEQSQAQAANEAQEEVRSLRGQTQELEAARAKIASLEDRIVKARAFFAEFDVGTNSEPRDEAEELKAKIESLEVQVSQMKVVEQFQAQAEELKAALAKITELEAQTAQSEKQAQEEILLLKSESQDQNAQAQELEAAQAKVKDMESQVAQAQEEILSLRAQIGDQAQELQESQAKIKDLEAKVPKLLAVHDLMPVLYTMSRQSSDQHFCIVQNDVRLYLMKTLSGHIFTKFLPKKDATLELAGPDLHFVRFHRVTVSDGQDWETIGHVGPENNTLLIGSLVWKWVTKRTPAKINFNGNEEHRLIICVDI